MPERPPVSEGSLAPVLIIEDQDDLLEALRLILQHEGYPVIACRTALDAITRLQNGERVCLIVLDLMMPEVNGFQFRAEQRADPGIADIPVVVMTGMAEPHEYHGNLRAVGYLRKPFDPAQILEYARQYCTVPPGDSSGT